MGSNVGRVSEKCEKVIDIGIVLDSSSSVGNNWPTLKAFVKDYIKSLNVGQSAIHVGLVRFSSTAKVEFYLSAHYTQDELSQAIDNIQFDGQSSNLAIGIQMLRQEIFKAVDGDRGNVINVGVIIADGNPDNPSEAVRQANLAKAAGITLVAVGVTTEISTSLLEQIASDSSKVLRAETFGALGSIVEPLANKSCVSQSYSQSGESSLCLARSGVIYMVVEWLEDQASISLKQ